MKRLLLFNKIFLLLLFFVLLSCNIQPRSGKADQFQDRIDMICIDHNIPGMALCIFSGDSVYEYIVSGIKRLGFPDSITQENIWHLGSNTKSFIAFAAASMVEEKLIFWQTKFFDLFPEYRNFCREEYHDITLMQLLRHRAGLPENTRSFPELILKFIDTDTVLERRTLFEWALNQDKYYGGYQYSNIGYVMAATMLENAAGKPWKEILEERVFTPLSIQARYGWPAKYDSTDTWGHLVQPETGEFMPHPPDDLYYLERIGFGPAGDLSLSIPDFVKFLQDNLRGWNGKKALLKEDSYKLIHKGKDYGLGWGMVDVINENFYNVSIHSGSAGTFYSKALLFKDENIGILICMNRYVENNNDMVFPLVNKILDVYYGRK